MRAVKEFRLSDDTEVFIYDDGTIELIQHDEYDDRHDVIDLTFLEIGTLYQMIEDHKIGN